MLSKVTSRALRRREQCRGQLCMCVQSSRISFSAPRVCFRLFWRFYFAFYSSFSSRCSWIFLYGLYRTTQNGLCLLARSLACLSIHFSRIFIHSPRKRKIRKVSSCIDSCGRSARWLERLWLERRKIAFRFLLTPVRWFTIMQVSLSADQTRCKWYFCTQARRREMTDCSLIKKRSKPLCILRKESNGWWNRGVEARKPVNQFKCRLPRLRERDRNVETVRWWATAIAGHVGQACKIRVAFLIGQTRWTARFGQTNFLQLLDQLERCLQWDEEKKKINL